MSPRLLPLIALTAVVFAVIAAVTVPGAVRDLRDSARSAVTPTTSPDRGRESKGNSGRPSRPKQPDARPRPAEPARPAAAAPTQVDDDSDGDGGTGLLTYAVYSLLGGIAAGLATTVAVSALTVRRRLRKRRTRVYERYEVHLSMHDEAKTADLHDMVEALGNLVREFPEQRIRDGQPYVALELFYGPGPHGEMEWTLCLLIEPDLARDADAIFCAAYPDLRLGRTHGTEPAPIAAPPLPVPGHVLRFRKSRSAVYAINSDSDELSSPPLEAIAQQQVALGVPSAVRIQLTPTPLWVEDWARRRYTRHENKLVRSQVYGLAEAGLRSELHRKEMRDGERTQNRGMFWLEIQVAADTREHANRIAAALTARRADNRLHRRWMIVREDLYRRRFPAALPPLWPTLSGRSLVSSAEVAHLIELPSARMRTVPVRRLTVPRIGAPPEIMRATDDDGVALPPGVEAPAVQEVQP